MYFENPYFLSDRMQLTRPPVITGRPPGFMGFPGTTGRPPGFMGFPGTTGRPPGFMGFPVTTGRPPGMFGPPGVIGRPPGMFGPPVKKPIGHHYIDPGALQPSPTIQNPGVFIPPVQNTGSFPPVQDPGVFIPPIQNPGSIPPVQDPGVFIPPVQNTGSFPPIQDPGGFPTSTQSSPSVPTGGGCKDKWTTIRLRDGRTITFFLNFIGPKSIGGLKQNASGGWDQVGYDLDDVMETQCSQ